MFLAPYTAIADIDGSPLDAGFLFFGEYGKDPELFPIEVFWDADFTVPAAQPIRTRNGYPVRNGSPTKVYLKTAQHSIVIKNRNSAFILVDFKNKGWSAHLVVDESGLSQQTINSNLISLANENLSPYFHRTDRDGMDIDSDLLDQLISEAYQVGKAIKFRPTDVLKLTRSAVIPNFGVELPAIVWLEIDFNNAAIVPQVDNLICFKVLAEGVVFKNPRFDNRLNKQNCWAYRIGAENDQIAGDPANARISTNRFKIYNPLCYGFYGFQWVKPSASIGGTMVDGVMHGGTLSGSYYGDVFNPRIHHTNIAFWFDYCVTHDNQSTIWNIYNPQHVVGNCMFLLDNIAGLNVFGGSYEFIEHYESSPLLEPTVIRVRGRQNENSPYATNNCNFFGLTGESLTRFYHVDDKGYLGDALSLINCVPIAPALPSIGTAGQTSTSFEGSVNAVTANGSVPSFLAWDKVSNRSIELFASDVPKIACVPDVLGIPDRLKTSSGSLILGTQADKNTDYVAIDYLERDMIFRNARGGGFAFERNNGAFYSPVVYPRQDAGLDLGAASNRWGAIFAVNGVIQTSDIRHKTNIQDISELENKVALKLKSLIKKFKFKDAVADKGENARYHIGVIAQEVEAAFAEFNLNAFDYGILCFDEWKKGESSIASSDGNIYSVRYDELMMFILASM